MKKTILAAQAFALLAIVPLVATLELTHVQQRSTPHGIIYKTENTIMTLPEKATDKLTDESLNVTLETIMLKTAY